MLAADRQRFWIAVAVLTAVGLGLRLAAAQGALWLDEAWSAVAAHDVGTPLGVFLQVNQDNNHHLNTLWLQLVGLDAQPVAQRALSIACGMLAIPVAAALGARQSLAGGICAALLFAISPLLVTYGAEAQGYAPMVLALLIAVALVARWLDDPSQRVPVLPLAMTVLLGMFSQLTMAFGVAALISWIGWDLFHKLPVREARRRAGAILLPILLPTIAALALILGAVYAAGTGIRLGDYQAFQLGALANGVGAMFLATFGGPLALLAALVLIAPPDRPSERDGRSRDRLCFLLLLAIPLVVALLQIPNSGAPRHHLLTGVGALMLVAVHSGPRLAPGHSLRWPVALALGLVVLASLITDWRIIGNRRADPGLALDAVAARAPGGADAAVDRRRSSAVLRAAAASRHYPLQIIEDPCPVARFLFVDRDGNNPFPNPAIRCGAPYHVIAEGHPTGLSGTHWKLYERN